jgi:2-polyprenyl-6-methoxyphenol hydroxylase-like FAD-dependent oxidoreductase
LHKAGIEHIVLERRDNVAPPEGASIAMYPHGARILHQLGCLTAVQAACVPSERWWYRGPDGKNIMDNGFFLHLENK